MALSNIFRELRREITESAVGLAVFGGFGYLDYKFAIWLESVTPGFRINGEGCPVVLGMMAGVILVFFTIAVVIISHEFGDAICNVLQDVGIHLRPKNRPRR